MMYSPARSSRRRTKLRARGAALLVIVVLLAIVGLGAGGTWYYFSKTKKEVDRGPLTYTVAYQPFIHDIVEQGEIESSENVEIRCEVKARQGGGNSGFAILWVIPEGTNVEKGDVLVKLDSASFENELTQQEILVTQAEAAKVQSQSLFEAAEIAKREYLEGTFKELERTILNEIFAAKENLERAQLSAESAERLGAKGLVRSLQVKADQFATDKARNELELAETKLEVLREFTRARMLKTLEADITSAKALWDAEIRKHELELAKLNDIRKQFELCTIRAPEDGQVVYANRFSSRGSAEFVVEQGATVREQQTIIRLPDPDKMQVKATINEAKVTMVRAGMPATIRLDAFQDLKLRGEVIKVNKYAEPAGWGGGGVKKYAAYIKIVDPPREIRSGMNSEVSIHVERRERALAVPVQAVLEHGRKFYCLVKNGLQWETREVKIGANNDQFVTIDSGVSENDRVALSPRSHGDLLALPALSTPVEMFAENSSLAPEAAGQAGSDAALAQGGPGQGASGPGGSFGEGPGGEERGGPPGGPRGPGQGGNFNPEAIVARIMGSLDANGDGVITADEMSNDTTGRAANFDANGDGMVTREEILAGVARRRAEGGPGGGSGGGPPGSAAVGFRGGAGGGGEE